MTYKENDAQLAYPELLLSGLDSLYVGYSLDGLGFDWEELQYQKECLKQDRRQNFKEIELGGRKWALSPRGRFPYRYVLSNEYLQVSLAEAMQPNCYVQFLSAGLWSKGYKALHQDLLDWFKAMGTRQVRPESVSRADFAFDFNVPLVDFTPDNFVTRAVKDAQWRQHGNIQTIQLGSGSALLRLYDKVAEIEQASQKFWFYDLWGQKENVWRVEFQVRKERLKRAGIESLESLELLRGDLLREPATKHSSLRQMSEDCNHSRWPLHPLWEALLAAIESEPQTGLIEVLRSPKALTYALQRQLQSLYGDLKGLGALVSVIAREKQPLSLEELTWRLPKLLRTVHHAEIWQTDVQKRMDARRLGQ